MKSNPRILISNDDGIDAAGIKLLQQIAGEISDDVWVVAPDTNQSGASHRFTLGIELEYKEHAPRVFSLNGSPADCIVAGYTHLLHDNPPDIVLAGINHGQNMGDIINCSGTAAAAREGALQGALGIALSQAVDYANQKEVDWDNAKAFGASVLKQLISNVSLGEQRNADLYYNINIPFCATADVTGVKVVPHQRYDQSVFRHYPSKNEGKFFVSIPKTPTPMQENHDFHALHGANAITVTPLTLRISDTSEVARLQGKLSLNP